MSSIRARTPSSSCRLIECGWLGAIAPGASSVLLYALCAVRNVIWSNVGSAGIGERGGSIGVTYQLSSVSCRVERSSSAGSSPAGRPCSLVSVPGMKILYHSPAWWRNSHSVSVPEQPRTTGRPVDLPMQRSVRVALRTR
ncbi:hypothetical protein LUX01_19955 [Streptomyces sudanensis]|uniref:hypothetical protein n=1 Tax=Streptomyces sudanensis TaxID=436397 RepID=UPI0020CE16D2|nr:hypothetical protein [Streptomyces sudanensis]MCP9988613.1 hypothetical protein [Streptomyces sudanensis]